MSEDPETARQIAELARDTRPLLVLDVDDVLMEFIRPFVRYLGSEGFAIDLKSFRLFENISSARNGEIASRETVRGLIDGFFSAQSSWQGAVAGAAEAISALAPTAEVVMLTAMPHRHRATRRLHLDELGFPYPLVTTESAKGPAIRQLRGETGRPVAFVDDIPNNLTSARAALADVHLFHLMAMPSLRSLLAPLPEDVVTDDHWPSAGPRIAAALGIGPQP